MYRESSMENFDLIVIGSGPGGYVCAIRAAQLGMKTAIIERYPSLGGTCLNVGCIPSKALLDTSEKFFEAKHKFGSHGLEVGGLNFDWTKVIARKSKVIKQTCDGINFLMKKNKIKVFHGHGTFTGPDQVLIKQAMGDVTIKGNKIVIATGSKPSTLPNIQLDRQRIISSTEALSLQEVPDNLLVIGAGVIGLELGAVYSRMGSKVSFFEFADGILPTMDKDLGKELEKYSQKQLGQEFYLGHGVTSVEVQGNGVLLTAKNNKTGDTIQMQGDYCLVCVGRRPFTENLGLEAAGISLDERGRVVVNDHLQTSNANVYAIGDVIPGAMLAHKAEEEGVMVAELLAGQKPHINYNLIPGVVYTWPEVASVGATEAQLKENKTAYNKGVFPFKASGRARASDDIDGFIKVLVCKQTDEILGVHMIGPRAADMIAEAVLAMEYKASAEDIARTCHAHPTFTESFKEACLAATENRAIHI